MGVMITYLSCTTPMRSDSCGCSLRVNLVETSHESTTAFIHRSATPACSAIGPRLQHCRKKDDQRHRMINIVNKKPT